MSIVPSINRHEKRACRSRNSSSKSISIGSMIDRRGATENHRNVEKIFVRSSEEKRRTDDIEKELGSLSHRVVRMICVTRITTGICQIEFVDRQFILVYRIFRRMTFDDRVNLLEQFLSLFLSHRTKAKWKPGRKTRSIRAREFLETNKSTSSVVCERHTARHNGFSSNERFLEELRSSEIVFDEEKSHLWATAESNDRSILHSRGCRHDKWTNLSRPRKLSLWKVPSIVVRSSTWRSVECVLVCFLCTKKCQLTDSAKLDIWSSTTNQLERIGSTERRLRFDLKRSSHWTNPNNDRTLTFD